MTSALALSARTYLALWAATLLPAAIAALIGVDSLPVPDGARHGTPREALDILAINLRLVLVLLAAALLLRVQPAWKPIFDVIVFALLAFNAAVVGIAIAAYGPGIARWLTHLPLEWGAFAVAAAAYCHARKSSLSWPLLTQYGAFALLSLVAGALVETFLLPL